MVLCSLRECRPTITRFPLESRRTTRTPSVVRLSVVIYLANGRVATGLPTEVLTTESLTALYGVRVEVLRDSRGNLVIVGGEDSHKDPAP